MLPNAISIFLGVLTLCRILLPLTLSRSTDLCTPFEDLEEYFASVLTGRNFSASVSYSMLVYTVSSIVTTTLTYQSTHFSELKMNLVSEEGCSSSWVTNLIMLIIFCIFFCIILGIMIYYLIQHVKSSTGWLKRQAFQARPKLVKHISTPIPLNRNPYTINAFYVCLLNIYVRRQTCVNR